MNCPNCNSVNVMEGSMAGHYGVHFIKKGTENKLRPDAYKVECKACEDCGAMFDFRIKLKEKKK